MFETSVDNALDKLAVKDGLSVSFHHHLRNGDGIINTVLEKLYARNVQGMHVFISAIFPSYTSIIDGIKNGHIDSITTNYMNGPVADYIYEHGLKGSLTMQTHGGRARAIKEGESVIDIAFVAAPTVDKAGNVSGAIGKSACGSLGYVMEDVAHANTVVCITDTLVETIDAPQIDGRDVDMVVHMDSIGDPRGIVSGTLSITTDPVGLKIARDAKRFLLYSGMIKDGVSFQSGAGGISLAITKEFVNILNDNTLTASFFTGGITAYHVEALEQGLVKDLYDVQCFDAAAIESIGKNAHHHAISADMYANPLNQKRHIKDLDIVILGAAEIDCDFNVNVTTDMHHKIIGGSGGHSDTAEDSKLAIIVSPLFKGRMPLIKKKVTTITTPGEHVDVLITERGIAINPRRRDLIDHFKDSHLPVMSIETLLEKAHDLSGEPRAITPPEKTLGTVESRHGKPLATLLRKG